MATVTKKRLINEISQEKGVNPTDVRNVIQAFLDKMTDCLSTGDRLEFRDFGVFEVVVRKRKIGRNPKNAAVPIVIPERSAVKFTPGKRMRRMIEDQQPGAYDEHDQDDDEDEEAMLQVPRQRETSQTPRSNVNVTTSRTPYTTQYNTAQRGSEGGTNSMVF